MFGEFTDGLALFGAFCLSSYGFGVVWVLIVGRRPRG